MARRYNRDSRGRFASGGGGGSSKRPAARGIGRGTNRLTRDNSGRITSVGGDGATARGGRLRTASGKQRATQTARISGGRAAGTVTRSGARRTAAAAAAAKPAKGSAAAQKIEWAKGRTKVLMQSKNALNQQLKSINAQIKQAGPSAGGLRLQKLQIQDRLSQLRRDIAASKAAARG